MGTVWQIGVVGNDGAAIEAVRELWLEYWESLGFDGAFQGFAAEVSGLPGLYAAPDGRLLLARIDGQAAGTAAFRRLNETACEAKRLYVRPQYRGTGLGKALLTRLMEEARGAGYREMYGDTLQRMEPALRLYDQAGFLRVGPYSAKPTEDAIYLKISL